jgi:hypothetical protein
MSYALQQQATWTCSVCGHERSWDRVPHEIVHQQTRIWHRFVCESCIATVVQMLSDGGREALATPGSRRVAAA